MVFPSLDFPTTVFPMLAKATPVHMIFDKTSDLLAVTDVRSRICVWMGSRRRSGSFPAEVLALPLVALRRAV